jgi:hypothetical protein
VKSKLMTAYERDTMRRTFSQWHVPPRQAEEILRHAVFGPGALGLRSEQMEPGVAIMVNERRDPQLASLFRWRDQVGDEQVAAQWRIDPVARAHVVMCPHAPEAVWAYHVTVLGPIALTRTYLLLVSKHAHVLSLLRESDSVVWLVQQSVAMREWAREGLGTAYDLLSHALPVGLVTAPPRGLEQALEHVGFRER